MNPLHKTLPLFASGIVLFLLFFITFFYLSPASAAEKNSATSTIPTLKETEQKTRISLTKEEREWLSANPHIKLATLTNQPPFSMMDADRNHTGMLADILALMSDAIGQRIETKLVDTTFSDIHEVAKEEGIYGSASILNTSRYANDYRLTDSYYTTPFYIYATIRNRNAIRQPADLRGKRVAVPRNHRAVAEYLDRIGGVKTLPADTPLEQMQKVVSGEADVLIGYFTYPYLVNKYLMVDLAIAFVAKSNQGIRIGVNPQHPALHSILNKAIATLGDQTIAAISDRWMEAIKEEVSRTESRKAKLTTEEQAWLKAHPDIKFGFTDAFEPFLIKGQWQNSGVLVDLLGILNQRLGTQFELEIDPWSTVLERTKTRELEGVMAIARETADAHGLLNTETIFSVYPAFYIRGDAPFSIRKLDDIRGRSVVILKSAQVMENILEPYKNDISIVRLSSNLQCLQMLFNGKVDIAFGLTAMNHLISKYKLAGINAAYTIWDRPAEVVMGVRPDLPKLVNILNKGIASFSQREIDAITLKWLLMKPEASSIDSLFTAEEQAWLAEHPEIALGASTDYPPMVIKTADGTHVGVLVDLFEQISRRLNTRIGLHIEDSWADIQERAQNREIDGLAFGARDPSRDTLYNATDIVMPTYFSVFGRSRFEYQIKRFSDLDGMRIGYKKAARPTRSLLEKLPSAILVPFNSHESMTQALLSREIDVIVAWISYDHWRKDRMQGTIDNILLIDEYPIEMFTYIRDDWPELIPILNKALASLQKDDLPRIINKWFGEWPQLSTTRSITLTPEERAWLDQKHIVRVRIIDFPPLLISRKDQKPTGMNIDYLNLISERTGVNFQYVITSQPFTQALEGLKQQRGPDLISTLMRTPEREKDILFTDDIFGAPRVIFSTKERPFISGMKDLFGRAVTLQRGSVVHRDIERSYPDIKLMTFDTDEEAIKEVAMGKADAYIGNLVLGSYLILQHGLTNVKVASPTKLDDHLLSFGIRKDWPELKSILNKGLESISPVEKLTIRNKYLSVRYEHGVTSADILKWVLIVAGAASGLVMFFVVWNKQLSRKVKERTTEVVESETKYRGLVDNSIVGVFASTLEGRFTFVNDALAQMFDFDSPETMIAQGSLERWRDPRERDRMVTALQKHGRVTNFEAETLTHTDRYIHVLFSARQIGNDIFGMVMDITDRKKAEQEIIDYQQRLKALASQLAIVEEKERRRIAIELHDHVGQSLALARIQIATVRRSTSETRFADKLDKLSDTLLKAIEDTQTLMLELSSPAMNESGLSSAISEWLELQIGSRHGIKTEFIDNIPDDPGKKLDANVRTILFRNVRELLFNVVKHARAEKIRVRLEDRNIIMRIIVEDDGMGFDPGAATQTGNNIGGFGLFSIEELMADLGGSLRIVSEPGKGCTAILSVPFGGDDNQVES